MNYTHRNRGTCSSQVDFSIEDGKLHNVRFHGGCDGNTKAVAKLLEGMDAERAVEILKGNQCGFRGTSCADQLAIGVENALKQEKEQAQDLQK